MKLISRMVEDNVSGVGFDSDFVLHIVNNQMVNLPIILSAWAPVE